MSRHPRRVFTLAGTAPANGQPDWVNVRRIRWCRHRLAEARLWRGYLAGDAEEEYGDG